MPPPAVSSHNPSEVGAHCIAAFFEAETSWLCNARGTLYHRFGPVQKDQRKMSVWAVAGLWGRIGWFPDLVSMKITQIGGKDLIISAVPVGA